MASILPKNQTKPNHWQLLTVDTLVPSSKKNAANCDKSCELQNSWIIESLNANCAPVLSLGMPVRVSPTNHHTNSFVWSWKINFIIDLLKYKWRQATRDRKYQWDWKMFTPSQGWPPLLSLLLGRFFFNQKKLSPLWIKWTCFTHYSKGFKIEQWRGRMEYVSFLSFAWSLTSYPPPSVWSAFCCIKDKLQTNLDLESDKTTCWT